MSSTALTQLSPVPVQTPVLTGNNFTLGWTQWFQALYEAVKSNPASVIYVVGSTQYPGIASALSAINASESQTGFIFTSTDETFTSNPFAGLPPYLNVGIFMSCTWTTSVTITLLTAGIVIRGSGRDGTNCGIIASGLPANSSVVCIGDNTTSYQGTRMEDLVIDAGDIAGSTCLEMYGAAESSGARNCAFVNYGKYGIYLHGQNTTNFELEHCVVLPSAVSANGNSVGIYANDAGGNTNFINRFTIAGQTGLTQSAGVEAVDTTLNLSNIHAEGCVDEIFFNTGSNGLCEHIIGGGTLGTKNVIHIATQTGSVILLHISDPSAQNLVQNDNTGETITTAQVPSELALYMTGSTLVNTTKELYFY